MCVYVWIYTGIFWSDKPKRRASFNVVSSPKIVTSPLPMKRGKTCHETVIEAPSDNSDDSDTIYDISEDNECESEMSNLVEALPMLCGSIYLLKSNKFSKRFQKKYVFVKDGYLIWNKKKVFYSQNDKLCHNELNNYDGYLSLLMIKSIKKYSTKKGLYQFIINAINVKTFKIKNKEYIFKCDNESQRNDWIDGLTKYCNKLMNVINTV